MLRMFMAGVFVAGCAAQPAAGPRRVSPDTVLIFEQRRASADASAAAPDWEAYRLYQSGRFVYSRAGAAPTQVRIAQARLQAVRAWLAQHDSELVRRSAKPSAPTRNVTASCQLHLSTGLVLAPFGDPRYDACEKLSALCANPGAQSE